MELALRWEGQMKGQEKIGSGLAVDSSFDKA